MVLKSIEGVGGNRRCSWLPWGVGGLCGNSNRGGGGGAAVRGKRTYGGRSAQHVEEQGTWASRIRKHSEAGYGRPVDRGAWTAKTVKRPRQQPAHPQYANYWAPLTRKRHTMPHPAQPRHTNHWAPRMRKRHQQEHRLQRPTESSNPTQHAKGRTGDCPGPRKETTTRRNVTQGGKSQRKELFCEHTWCCVEPVWGQSSRTDVLLNPGAEGCAWSEEGKDEEGTKGVC